jgi:hypothetical protein
MKQVPRHDHHVGLRLNDLVHRPAEGVGHVRFPLIESGRRLAVVLAESEMQVREMGNLHAENSKPGGSRRK